MPKAERLDRLHAAYALLLATVRNHLLDGHIGSRAAIERAGTHLVERLACVVISDREHAEFLARFGLTEEPEISEEDS